MRNRIYNLGTGFKILGMSLDDVALIVLTWFISFQILGGMLPGRVRFLVGFATTGLFFMIWRSVKDHVPSGFLPHFLGWIAERSTYDVTPDTNPHPVWIDHNLVSEVHDQEKRAQLILKRRNRRSRQGLRWPA